MASHRRQQRIGSRYKLLRLIAEGASSEVHDALDLHLHKGVIIKIMNKQSEPIMVKRFLREAGLLAHLDHPNIVRTTDLNYLQTETDQRELYFVMERLVGSTLQALLRKHGALQPAMVLTILGQVAAALDTVHADSLGIVHRDLKPGNIFIHITQNKQAIVKLLDFGVARMNANDVTQMTEIGIKPGTLAYRSPETVRNQPVSPASDIFALAVIGLEMLTGRNPFRKNDEAATLSSIAFLPLPVVPPDLHLPPGVQTVLHRSLDRNPALRHPTAGAFVRDLEAQWPELRGLVDSVYPRQAPVLESLARYAMQDPSNPGSLPGTGPKSAIQDEPPSLASQSTLITPAHQPRAEWEEPEPVAPEVLFFELSELQNPASPPLPVPAPWWRLALTVLAAILVGLMGGTLLAWVKQPSPAPWAEARQPLAPLSLAAQPAAPQPATSQPMGPRIVLASPEPPAPQPAALGAEAARLKNNKAPQRSRRHGPRAALGVPYKSLPSEADEADDSGLFIDQGPFF